MSLCPLCSVTTDLEHGSSGFWQSLSPATEGPLKISPLFPNGLSHRSRREGERGGERAVAFFFCNVSKSLASARAESFREQTVKCVLLNEATVPLSQSLLPALLVCSGRQEHMFSLYHLALIPSLFLSFLSPTRNLFIRWRRFSLSLGSLCVKTGYLLKRKWQVAVGSWVTLLITHLEVCATLFPIAQTQKALLCGCNSVDIKIICSAPLLSIDKSGLSLGTKRLQQNKRTILKVWWFFKLTVFSCAETMNVMRFWTYLLKKKEGLK